jgi:cell division protein FtsB
MLKKFFAVLAIALAGLLILCWIYLPSITRYRELKSEEERLTQKIREIDEKIKVLADERHLLQTDVAYLEKVIREELGFVKPGEIVYELVTTKNPSNASLPSSGDSVTPSGTSTSGAKALTAQKSRVNPMSVVASLANTSPKVAKKKSRKTAV